LKALLCKQFGPPESLVLEDVPSPKPGAGEVVIRVKAASVNFPDVLIIQNKYQFKPPLPFSPGSELAGVVKEVGEGVHNVKPGDKVIAFTTFGAFAEEAKTDCVRLLPMPEGMSYEAAASFILTYGTTDHALRDRGQLRAGESLVVLGAAGGVGVAAIEIGKALGARVIACASSDEKLAVCRQHGADETVNYATEDLRERLKSLGGAKGVDVIYDAVGGPYTGYPCAGEDASGTPVPHPGWSGLLTLPQSSDVGVVRITSAASLPGSFGTLAPVGYLDRLATRSDKQSTRFTIVGYGAQDWRPVVVASVQRLTATVELVNRNSVLLRPWNVQVSGSPGKGKGPGGICYGDSGGPLLHDTGPGEVIVAVSSYVYGPNCTGPSGFYRVDTTYAQSFIAGR